ncbi:threonyl-tRNA synthetase editing domain-containing protein [Deferrisoma palaeochoriense]
MRVLLWYCGRFAWRPAFRTLETAPPAEPGEVREAVVAFVHVEPGDGPDQETKLVKNVKWLARKWNVRRTVLHSFTHLAEEKADPDEALELLRRAAARLEAAQYPAALTPYGYYHDLTVEAPGHPLARIFKAF